MKASITEPESAYKVRPGYSIRTEDSIFNFPGWDLFRVIYVRISFALHSHRGHPGPIYLLRLLPGMLCRVSVAVFCFRRYSAAFFVLCSAQKRRVILPFYIFFCMADGGRADTLIYKLTHVRVCVCILAKGCPPVRPVYPCPSIFRLILTSSNGRSYTIHPRIRVLPMRLL